MVDVPPLLLERRVLPKVWGGTWLSHKFRLATEPRVGETWEVYDRQDGASKVRSETLRGESLATLLRQQREPILGRRGRLDGRGRFPLLLKFVDCREPLSVQVHPDDALAAQSGADDTGKNEAWVVVAVTPEAAIWRGLRPGVTRDEVAAATRTGAFEPILQRLTPKVGDVFDIPAGTVHCMAGVTVFEVQQNSDLTWRLHDWNRVGQDGQPRPLHVAQALAAIRYDAPVEGARAPQRLAEGVELLVRNEYFSLQRLTLRKPVSIGT